MFNMVVFLCPHETNITFTFTELDLAILDQAGRDYIVVCSTFVLTLHTKPAYARILNLNLDLSSCIFDVASIQKTC